MKTFVLTVSRNFPQTHKRAGEPTRFIESIEDISKIHTIRGNYDLWVKRIEQVQKGEAIISLRYWSGKPYNSKQVEFKQLTKEDGVGVQKYYYPKPIPVGQSNIAKVIADSLIIDVVSKRDGLSKADFIEWFKKCDTEEPMAIIHFTKFRY